MIKFNNYKNYLLSHNFILNITLETFEKEKLISFICKNNHITTLNINSFSNKKTKFKDEPYKLCTQCVKEIENNKLFLDYKEKIFKFSKNVLESLEYSTGSAIYICGNCKGKSKSNIRNLINKTKRCSKCVNDDSKLDINYVNMILGEFNYVCLEYKNNKTLLVKCDKGHLINSLSFHDYNRNRRCPSCSSSRRKETNIEKYGSECVFQSEYFKDKNKETCLEKYGVEHHMKNNEIFQKVKETNKQKYGVEYVFTMDSVYEKIKEIHKGKYGVEFPLQSKYIQEKIQSTFMNKIGTKYPMLNREHWKSLLTNLYGVEHYSKHPDFVKKYKDTCIEKYGVEHYSKHPDFVEKYKNTCIEKYGVENYSKHPDFVEKYKDTCIEKYGVEHPMQNSEIFTKALHLSFKLKPYTFESGNIIFIQGYEQYCIDDLLKENYKENEIITNYLKMPIFLYNFNNKTKRYYPDIMVKKNNLIFFIEVKSQYTFDKDIEKNNQKWSCVTNNNFNIEVRIYDNNGKIKEKIFYKANNI